MSKKDEGHLPHPVVPALQSMLIPGLGQWTNQQRGKAALLGGIFVALPIAMWLLIDMLSTNPEVMPSVLLLLFAVVLIPYFWGVIDAYRHAAYRRKRS